MRRLVVVGNGNAADAFLRQIQRFRRAFSITVFSGGEPLRDPAWYRGRGIDIRPGVAITGIDRYARVALGDDGSRTTFDRLILATGQSQLRPAGLAAKKGVIVNRSLETSDGHIYAIGDCAEICDASAPAAFSASLEQLARNLAARLAAEAVGEEAVVKVPKYKVPAARNLNPAATGRVLTA
jgi:NAD(P)H-nitrite reductase large subunit